MSMTERTLEGPTWHLDRGVAIPPGTTISARFVGGTVSGHAGLNRYRADYVLTGDTLELGPAATTLMAGDPAVMRAEHDYLQLLGAIDGYRLEDEGLVLMDRGRTPILWFRAAPDVDQGIVGTWSVRGVRISDGVVSNVTDPDRTMTFTADGQVSGQAGVNTFRGSARVDGDRIVIGPLRTTRMAGSPEAMDAEAAFLEALEAVVAVRLEGDDLTLLDADEGTQVRLVRASGSADAG
jgi:heat shock protein HslJ